MSTEHREMRPFSSVGPLDEFVESIRLHVGDSVMEPGATMSLETDAFLRISVALKLAKNGETLQGVIADLEKSVAMQDLGLTIEDLELVVIASSPFLKIVDMVARFPLAELGTRGVLVDVSGTPRRDALLSPNSGSEIDVMVCLSKAKPKAPLRPWRRGTWISRAAFALTTEQALTGFTPRPMDAAKKAELEIPTSTARYISMKTSPLDEIATEDDVEMWVDSDLLAQMSAMPKSKGSVALQRQLFIDAVAAIVMAAHQRRDADDGTPILATCIWPDIEKSLIGRVIGAMTPPVSDPDERNTVRGRYLDLLREDPARFMAHVEDLAGVSKSFHELVEG